MATGIRRVLMASAIAALPLLAGPLRAQDVAAAPVAVPPPVPLTTAEPRIEDFTALPGAAAWPTLETTTDGEAAVVAEELRYTVEINGLVALGLEPQYRGLSALWTKRNDVANLAQINRRVSEDRDLIDQLLRSVGHYGGNTAVVITPPVRSGAKTRVALVVDPGPVYTFDSIAVTAPADAIGAAPEGVVTPLLGISTGEAVDAAKVTAGQDGLAQRLADKGFAFPVIGKPEIVIDHASRTATLVQTVDLGARGVFGAVHITGEVQGFSDAHLAVLARFKPGQPYTASGRDDLRRALIQTGLFGAVDVKPVASGPVRADGSQAIDLIAAVDGAPVRTVAATGGYSTGQGIRVEASWANRNFFKPEGGVTFRGVAAEREQVLTAELRRRNFRKRDQTLVFRTGLSAEQQNAFDATTFEIGAAIDRESNIVWQKPWTYSAGVELLATRQRDRSAPADPKQTYFILAFPGSITWDQSDDLLNPSRGFRLTGRLSPELTVRSGKNLNYVKAQIEATGYQPLGRFVLAGRIHLGAIAGASRGRIAPTRRFYAGGGGSVRGFDYQGVGPKDADGSPTGGNSVTEGSVEARYRFQAFGSDLGLVGFIDAGQVYANSIPRFNSLRVGAGIGLRYFTAFGPVRIDVATPIKREAGDPRVAFYVSIGQAF